MERVDESLGTFMQQSAVEMPIRARPWNAMNKLENVPSATISEGPALIPASRWARAAIALRSGFSQESGGISPNDVDGKLADDV